MPDQRMDLRNINLREILPWVHLFRGFRIALDFKKILLGAMGAFLMSLGWWAVASFMLAEQPAVLPEEASVESAQAPEDYDRYLRQRNDALVYAKRFPWEAPKESEADVFRSPFAAGGINNGVPSSFFLVLEPIRRVVFSATLMFRDTTSTLAGAVLTIWTLFVWALFGGAITRTAAVQIAKEGQISLSESIRFVLGRYLSYVGAPVLPFLGVLILVGLCLLAGLLTWVPFLDVVIALLWILPLLAGFVMAVALVGLALGWPLMYAAISAEATESFDALSRSYSYILERPWQYFFYSVIALIYGGILTMVVVTMGYIVVSLSQYAVSWGGGSANLEKLYAFVPEAGGWREEFGPRGEVTLPTGTTYYAALVVGLWTHFLFLGILGFVYSYFWSAATIIYFLLRHDVDETELEEVFVEEPEEEPFPTVASTLTTLTTPSAPRQGPASGSGFSLPIIDPPR